MRSNTENHTDAAARIMSRRGAASRPLIVAATLLLSVCSAVFTFWGMTALEARMTGGRIDKGNNTMGDEPVAVIDVSSGGDTVPTPSDKNGMIETAVTNAPSKTSTTFDSSSYTNHAQAQTLGEAQPKTRRLTPPPPSSLTPPAAPAVPYMIDNAPPYVNLFSLTFDGGSLDNAAGDILDTLASRNVKATMFLTGEFIRKYPQTVSRIAAQGHELGNHMHRHPRLTSYADDHTHATLPNVTRQFVANELSGAQKILADRTGLFFAPLWRAPYGEINRQIALWALEAGYVHIGWRQGKSWWHNLDTNDWIAEEDHPGYRTPQQVYDKIVNIAAMPGGLNGGIILMHLGTERKRRGEQAHIILGKLIDDLRGMGYEPVKVSTLLEKSGIDINDLAGRSPALIEGN